MWSTYLLIFLMLCIGAAGWLLFLWAVRSGQYDDVEGPKYRMLDEDEQEGAAKERSGKDQRTSSRTVGSAERTDGPSPGPST